jgi:Na+/H+ antiporter NhaD/arsenite permease-like protein
VLARLGWDPLWAATALLCLVYAAIVVDRLNRAIIVGLGACLAIVLGLLTQDEAIHGVDFNTLMLLTGMMLIVGVAKRSGIFQYAAIRAAKAVRASPAGILLLLGLITAVASALLDNVTTVLLIVPVTLAVTRELGVPAFPFLLIEVLAANVGGTATLIGDPPNIIIGSAAGLTFNQFVVHCGPPVLVILVVQSAIAHLGWGRGLHATDEARARVMALDEREAITDPRLMRHALAVLAGVIAAFVGARVIGLEPGTIAMTGAAVLVLAENAGSTREAQTHRVASTLGEVEWITLFFFLGLFVVVAAVDKAGLLKVLAEKLVAATRGDRATTVLAVLWVSAILSAVVDNIPFVATMVPLVRGLAPEFGGAEQLMPVWWALALGACLGGNGTLVGASANLTVAGLAERGGVPFRFKDFTRRALPLMLLSVGIAHVYLWVRYLR